MATHWSGAAHCDHRHAPAKSLPAHPRQARRGKAQVAAALNHPRPAREGEIPRAGARHQPGRADLVQRSPPAGVAHPAAQLGGDTATRIEARRGQGAQLPPGERAFFEPRLGTDLDAVRVHDDAEAAGLSRDLGARAFTLGADVFFGAGEFRPGTPVGRHLLAHELTHVLQQQAGDAAIRRQTIDPSCSSRATLITEAWNTARDDLLPAALALLELVRSVSARAPQEALLKTQRRIIENSFGDVGFIPGVGRLGDLIAQFERIAAALANGRTLKCSPPGTPSPECATYEACVVDGNTTDIFLNDSFFDPSKDASRRGITLIHELAHMVLGAEHGSSGDTAVFDCDTPFETSYSDARDNAYSYEMLVACANGLLQAANVSGDVAPPEATADPDAGLSLGASAGVGVGNSSGFDAATARFAGSISARYSFGAGEFGVFSPGIGFGILYLSPSEADPWHVAAVSAEFAGRFHLPPEGLFVDVGAGGFLGLDIDRFSDEVSPNAGLSGFAGIGWRWQPIEIGPELRAQLPLTDEDSPGMLVIGRFQAVLP